VRLINLIDKDLTAVTLNAAKNSDTVNVDGCQTLSFQLLGSAASSPVGTTVTLQRSNDGTNWLADGAATNIVGNGVLNVEKVDPTFRYYRLAFAWGSGSIVLAIRVLGKGYGN
jgi:hypothetical protein